GGARRWKRAEGSLAPSVASLGQVKEGGAAGLLQIANQAGGASNVQSANQSGGASGVQHASLANKSGERLVLRTLASKVERLGARSLACRKRKKQKKQKKRRRKKMSKG